MHKVPAANLGEQWFTHLGTFPAAVGPEAILISPASAIDHAKRAYPTTRDRPKLATRGETMLQ